MTDAIFPKMTNDDDYRHKLASPIAYCGWDLKSNGFVTWQVLLYLVVKRPYRGVFGWKYY